MEFLYETVYWVSLGVLAYTFLGYPALVLGRRKRSVAANPNYQPRVSLLVCAHNEESIIGRKIENALSTDYPAGKFDIVVVSDGSTDRTDEIVRGYDDPRLKFVTYPDRGGKAKALNTGIGHVTGELIVLTDANVMFEPDAIAKLASVFGDDSLGCAVGNVVLKSVDGSIAPEGVYSRYEKAIHTAEENWRTMITVDGAMYALRREFLTAIPADSLTDDWYLASGVLEHHRRIAYVPRAVGYEHAAETVSGEFTRKVRMVAGGYQTAFRRMKLFFNPVSFPEIAFMFFSHKLLRWAAGFFMALLYVTNVMLLHSLWYQLTLVAQTTFYVLALAGWLLDERTKSPIVHIPHYFVAVNLAAVVGLVRYLTGRQKVTWERGRG